MRIAAKVILTEAQRVQLDRWANARQVPVRLAQRAQIVLLAAEGNIVVDQFAPRNLYCLRQMRVGDFHVAT